MNYDLTPSDRFKIYNKSILDNNDRKTLSLLYQPIIGSDALNLYFTLWMMIEIDLKENNHHHLMSVMHISLKKIQTAREKLEAIGLLKSYINKEEKNQYIYELYSPLNGDEFFRNPVLSTSLKKNIGDTEFEKIVSLFIIQKNDLSNYENISKKFKDIFSLDNYEEVSGDFIKKEKIEIEVDVKVDIKKVLDMINEDIINHKLMSKEDIVFLERLLYVYGIDEETLKELIIVSANQYKKIDFIKIKKKCESLFQYDNDGKLPGLAYKKQPEALRSKSNELTKKQKMIHSFETTSPRDFLLLKNKNSVITNNDQKILSYLLLDLKLNPGVVNVLIDYVLRINDNKLVKNFIETIAIQWKRANVETVSGAMDIAENEFNRRKNYDKKKVYSKREEQVPDWFNKNIDIKKPDENRQKKIEDLLKAYE